MRLILTLLLFCSFSATAETTTQVIIAVKQTKLNNKNQAVDSGTIDSMRGIRYRLKKSNSDEIVSIVQKKEVKILELTGGEYCFLSKMHSYLNDGDYLRILNPLCFTVSGATPINTGTWLIGHSVSRKGNYALIVGYEENFDELAHGLAIKQYVIPKFTKSSKD